MELEVFMDIGAKLKEIRESRGLTGEALCTLLGKSGNSYISKIESGFKKDLNLGELKEPYNRRFGQCLELPQ